MNLEKKNNSDKEDHINLKENNLEQIKLIPDLYSRNLLISKLINLTRTKNLPLKILDIGGRSGQLGKFIPITDNYLILDIRKSELGEKNYVIGDISNTSFPNKIFDIVVSSDTYEHIDPTLRIKSLAEMLRISKNFVILGGPFYTDEIVKTELKANNLFLTLLGKNNPWLEEHIKNGLPRHDELESFLKENEYDFVFFETSNISNWLLLESFTDYAYANGISQDRIDKIYQFYNENLINLGHYVPPCYRRIYLIAKKGFCPNVDLLRKEIKTEINHNRRQELISLIFQFISEVTLEKNIHIRNLEAIKLNDENQLKQISKNIDDLQLLSQTQNDVLKQKDTILEQQSSQLKQKDTILEQQSSQLKQKDTILEQQSSQLKQKDTILEQQSSQLKQKDTILEQQSSQLKQKDTILEQQSSQLKQKDTILEQKVGQIEAQRQKTDLLEKSYTEINTNLQRIHSDLIAIQSSFTWKFLRKLDKIIFKLFPPHSKRNQLYRLALSASQATMNKGIVYTLKTGFKMLISKDISSIASNADQLHLMLSRDLQYHLWQLENKLDPLKILSIKEQINNFTFKPKISIVMPVFNTDPKWLQAAIESVLNQLYQNWELCIVDDCSTKPETKETLSKYAFDKRIKIKYLQKNLGISGASNESLSMCTGDFVGFLDHDDEIYPYALFEVVKKLNEDPNLDILYSDEDKTNSEGDRFDPFFKPDWSPALLFSTNYMAHFLVYKKNLLQNNLLRSEFDGAQDYDLVLRLTEKTNKIGHISKPLYSWRQITGSTSTGVNAKNYASKAARNALEQTLRRRKLKGEIQEGQVSGSYHVKYDLIKEPKVSIIIPTKDKLSLLKKCVDSLEKTNYRNYEVIIVDNNSKEKDALHYLNSVKHKVIKFDEKFNFSKINNFAAKQASGEYLLFLNNDTEIFEPDWLREMVTQLIDDNVGVVGPMLLYGNGTIQHGGVMVGFEGKAGNCFIGLYPHQAGYFGLHNMVRNCASVTAACMLVKRKIFDEVGGFDEKIPIAYGDVDLCLKILTADHNIVYTPYAKLFHHESASRGTLSPTEDAVFFNKKWNALLKKGDPYYNPNLSLLYIYQIKVNETYVPGTLVVPQPKPIPLYDRLLANDVIETRSLLLKQQINNFTFKPKISIVMPVFNTDPKWLQAAIESVLNQLYQNWELCIVDDCSTKPETKETLSKYAFDKRIKIKYLQKNLGISGASNESLSLCTGDFVGFLDHDDEIYPYALFEVVKKLNEDPNLDILYSDEDKLEDEKRVEPYFKPDWSPDLILSSHYMAHFLIYRKKLIDQVGGFRSEFDGSQDYDLVLRATEKTNRIGHIPKVLYGWRKIPSSTSQSLNAKSYAIKRTTKLIDDALKRRNIDGHAEYDEITTYHRVVYTITDNPLISIIIPTKDNLSMLKKCLDSISKSTYKNYEIIIISNSTKEETWKFLHATGHKIIEYKEKFNVSKVFNLAASFAKGSHLLFMNDDMQVVNPEWLNAMLEHSQRKEVGIVGCLLIYPPNEMGNEEIIQHAGVILGSRGVADHAFKHKKLSNHNYFNLHRVIRNCSVVTGACMMVKKRIFEEVGGWDERLAISYNDIDFCLRVSSKGYSTIYTPFSKLYHFEAATRGTLHPKEDEDYFIQKWEKLLLQGDRYYNCNLSLLGDPYSPSLYPHSNPALSSLLEVYYNRIDLQNVYPEAASGNYENLIKWALSSGLNETFSKYLLRPYLSFYSKYSDMKQIIIED